MSVKCVVFDLDDTLYPEEQYVKSGFRAVDSYLRSEYGVNGFLREALWLHDNGLRGAVFNRALEKLDFTYTEEHITSLVSIYRNHNPEIQIFTDAEWVLNYCFKKYVTGLITDGYAVAQRSKIEALGLRDCIDHIVISDELGREYWKPHEKPYLEIQLRSGFSGNECVYIGDNENKDFVTARLLGWKTFCVRRVGGEYLDTTVPANHKADFTIETLYGLDSHL